MFLDAIKWWGMIFSGVFLFLILWQIQDILKRIDSENKFLKNMLGHKIYNFLNRVL